MTASGSDLVSVIVPVYDGPDEIEACLTSLLTHARTTKVPFELILVDDASPAPAVAAWLDQLVGAPT
jgi:glycosyltransferase involved in cell wall biosynthesis